MAKGSKAKSTVTHPIFPYVKDDRDATRADMVAYRNVSWDATRNSLHAFVRDIINKPVGSKEGETRVLHSPRSQGLVCLMTERGFLSEQDFLNAVQVRDESEGVRPATPEEFSAVMRADRRRAADKSTKTPDCHSQLVKIRTFLRECVAMGMPADRLAEVGLDTAKVTPIEVEIHPSDIFEVRRMQKGREAAVGNDRSDALTASTSSLPSTVLDEATPKSTLSVEHVRRRT